MYKICLVSVLSAVLLLSGGCADEQATLAAEEQQMAQSIVNLAGVTLIFRPGRVVVETPATLELVISPAEVITEAYLTGGNMYMGKIPLRLVAGSLAGHWETQYILGACTEPEMIWQLTVQIGNPQGPVRQVQYEFRSYLR